MESTILYRYFDSDGDLLYVGITKNQVNRFTAHAKKSVWVSQISKATFTHFSTREAAIVAENAAIKDEKPKYNIAGTDRQRLSIEIVDKHFWSMFVNSWDQHDAQHQAFCKEVQKGVRYEKPEIPLGTILMDSEYVALSMHLAATESKFPYPNITVCHECREIFASDKYRNLVIGALSCIDTHIEEFELGQSK